MGVVALRLEGSLYILIQYRGGEKLVDWEGGPCMVSYNGDTGPLYSALGQND